MSCIHRCADHTSNARKDRRHAALCSPVCEQQTTLFWLKVMHLSESSKFIFCFLSFSLPHSSVSAFHLHNIPWRLLIFEELIPLDHSPHLGRPALTSRSPITIVPGDLIHRVVTCGSTSSSNIIPFIMPSSTFIGSRIRHHRPPNRRANSSVSSAASTSLNPRTMDEFSLPNETDAECWERMVALQQEYHCYNSARLEAAVEALENGYKIEEVPIRKSPLEFVLFRK